MIFASIYLIRIVLSAQECAKRADEYVTMHKNLRRSNQSHCGGKDDANSSKYTNNGNGNGRK